MVRQIELEMQLQFTGKERDAETGLDYVGARYFSGAQGRFTSVDPIWITKERMLDPQRLNLYAYARNNPLKYIDPTGMDITLGLQAPILRRVRASALGLGYRHSCTRAARLDARPAMFAAASSRTATLCL